MNLKDEVRQIVSDLSRLVAEDDTMSGTAARAEYVALTRIFFGVEALLGGELQTCQVLLDEADTWVVEAYRRRENETGMVSEPVGRIRH